MNDWWAANMKKVTSAKILEQIEVSSWACVIDLQWKKDFNPVRTNGVNPQTAAPYTYQALGSTGDTIGFHIKQANPLAKEKQQGAFLLRRTVTTLGVNANVDAQINAVA